MRIVECIGIISDPSQIVMIVASNLTITHDALDILATQNNSSLFYCAGRFLTTLMSATLGRRRQCLPSTVENNNIIEVIFQTQLASCKPIDCPQRHSFRNVAAQLLSSRWSDYASTGILAKQNMSGSVGKIYVEWGTDYKPKMICPVPPLFPDT